MEVYKLGTVIADRYEIVKMAGAGGMGVVYFAIDHKLDGLPVALKTFHRELLKERKVRDQFLKEATVWLELGNHPHIVEAYNIERIEGRGEVFIAAELIGPETGKKDASLRSWIQPGGMDWEQAVLFGLQIVWGMQHAVTVHPGLVHRDLKPENILVGWDQLEGTHINRLRVTDFGLIGGLVGNEGGVAQNEDSQVGLLEQRSQSMGGIAGTPAYMSPEQWLGKKLDCRSDIYAWGLIMAELLTGQRIAQGENVEKLQNVHLGGIKLRLPKNIPAALTQLIEQSVAQSVHFRQTDWNMIEEQIRMAWKGNGNNVLPKVQGGKKESREQRRRQMVSYNTIGSSYSDIGKYDVALQYYEKALDSVHDLGDQLNEGVVLGNMGDMYRHLGQYKQALNCFEKKLAIARALGNRRGEGNALGHIGNIYRDIGQYVSALSYYEQQLAIAHDLGDQHNECIVLGNLGDLHRNTGDHKQALDYCEQHLIAARNLKNQAEEARALDNLGAVHGNIGNYTRALQYHEQALTISRELSDRAGEGRGLGNIGIVYEATGKYEKALECQEQYLTIMRELDYRAGQLQALGNLGNVSYRLQRYERALDYFEQVLEINRELGNKIEEGITLGNIGSVYERTGRYEQALDCQEQALAIARKLGNRAGEATALTCMGNVYMDIHQYSQAMDCQTHALEIHRELGDLSGYAMAGYNLSIILARQGELIHALQYARQAWEIFVQIGQPQFAREAQSLVGEIEAEIGRAGR